jgi:hypothetical protein
LYQPQTQELHVALLNQLHRPYHVVLLGQLHRSCHVVLLNLSHRPDQVRHLDRVPLLDQVHRSRHVVLLDQLHRPDQVVRAGHLHRLVRLCLLRRLDQMVLAAHLRRPDQLLPLDQLHLSRQLVLARHSSLLGQEYPDLKLLVVLVGQRLRPDQMVLGGQLQTRLVANLVWERTQGNCHTAPASFRKMCWPACLQVLEKAGTVHNHPQPWQERAWHADLLEAKVPYHLPDLIRKKFLHLWQCIVLGCHRPHPAIAKSREQ